MTDPSDVVTGRRTVLAATGAAGLAALAGCTAENGEGNETEAISAGPPPLEFDPGQLDDAALRYLIESAQYQNEMLEAMRDDE